MANEPDEQEPLAQRLLFYTTAFFLLLAIFSLFAFLFLVPFVIEPAFTTIFMKFNETPATCFISEVSQKRGQTNCSWTSCKEGCTKEVYECVQIRVNYQRNRPPVVQDAPRVRRAIRDYTNYPEEDIPAEILDEPLEETLDWAAEEANASSEWWYYTGAKLMPNVKGCGYPPTLNCSIWNAAHSIIGSNFSCYYSEVDPGLVITQLDMDQVFMNIVYAMAIPIPSFIVSVIYLALAYFFIYNEEEEEVVKPPTEDGATPVPPPTSGALTPASEVFREDMASFGHQLKVAMADDISRESIFTDTVPASSNSLNGSSNKMLMTSIATAPGPIADV